MQGIVNEWMDDISQGIISLVHIFNPELVIIGGGVSSQSIFIEGIRKRVREKIMPRFAEDLKIEPAKLGNNAGLIGAVYYLLSEEN